MKKPPVVSTRTTNGKPKTAGRRWGPLGTAGDRSEKGVIPVIRLTAVTDNDTVVVSRITPLSRGVGLAGHRKTGDHLRDSAIEAMLADLGLREGVHWRFDPEYSLSKIDSDASSRNQARLIDLYAEHVDVLAEAMVYAPETIPPLIAWNMSKDRDQLLAGLHRYAAALRRKQRRWPTYVLTSRISLTQRNLIAWRSNRAHGLPLTTEERVEDAAWLVANAHMTIKDAAAELQIAEHKVQLLVTQRRLWDRLVDLNVTEARIRRIHPGLLARLANIHNDRVLLAVVDLAIDTSMNAADLSLFVTQLNKLRSEDEQLVAVDNRRVRDETVIAVTAGGITSQPREILDARRHLLGILDTNVSEIVDSGADAALLSEIGELARRAQPIIRRLGNLG